MLGFGGHFSSKSRRYSTTLTALRRARAVFAAWRHPSKQVELAAYYGGGSAVTEAFVVLASWRYMGTGYQTEGEAWLAARSAAADAREQRWIARLELAMA